MDKLQKLYSTWQSLQPLSERKQYLLSQRFSVDYNFNSNHIEGNTGTMKRKNREFRSPSTPKLLKSMLDNPDITIEGLATVAGISVAAVNKQLRQLLNKGYIQRSESDGSWRIFASSSI